MQILIKTYYAKTGKIIPFTGDTIGTGQKDQGFIVDKLRFQKVNRDLKWDTINEFLSAGFLYTCKPSLGTYITIEKV